MSRSKSKAKLAAKSRLKRVIEKSAAAKNAFEQIRTRKKFNILGKKAKGDTKRTTQMRSAAVEKVCVHVLFCVRLVYNDNLCVFVAERYASGGV